MIWLTIGYMFLFIFRPYEYWPVLGIFHVERIYMFLLIASVMVWKGKQYVPHGINRAVILFMAAIVLAAPFAIDTKLAWTVTFDYFKLLVFYFVIILTLRHRKDLSRFVYWYLMIMLIYVGKSAWEFFLNGAFNYRMGIKRMAGIDQAYGDPNAFAASIAYSLPFLWLALRNRDMTKAQKIPLIAYGVIGIVSIIFTGSRSGMVTALIFLLMAGMSLPRKSLGIIASAMLLIVAWAAMPETYRERFLSTFVSGANKSADASAQSRIYMLQKGIQMYQEHPVLGVGPGNFRRALGMMGEEFEMNAHNMYGQLLGELGTIGALAFLIILFLIVRTNLKTLKLVKSWTGPDGEPVEDRYYRFVAIAALQGIVLLLFNGNFGGNLYRFNWLWIGAITLLCSHFARQVQNDGGTEELAAAVDEIELCPRQIGVNPDESSSIAGN